MFSLSDIAYGIFFKVFYWLPVAVFFFFFSANEFFVGLSLLELNQNCTRIRMNCVFQESTGKSFFDSLFPAQGSVLDAMTSTQQPNESLLQHSASSVSLPDCLQQDNIRRSYSSTHSSLDGEEVKVSRASCSS